MPRWPQQALSPTEPGATASGHSGTPERHVGGEGKQGVWGPLVQGSLGEGRVRWTAQSTDGKASGVPTPCSWTLQLWVHLGHTEPESRGAGPRLEPLGSSLQDGHWEVAPCPPAPRHPRTQHLAQKGKAGQDPGQRGQGLGSGRAPWGWGRGWVRVLRSSSGQTGGQ